jgi:hypothetical protein
MDPSIGPGRPDPQIRPLRCNPVILLGQRLTCLPSGPCFFGMCLYCPLQRRSLLRLARGESLDLRGDSIYDLVGRARL